MTDDRILSPDTVAWFNGADEGRALARNGQRWQSGLSHADPKDRGRVAGWRLHNGLRATPLSDDYDNEVWGEPPEPMTASAAGDPAVDAMVAAVRHCRHIGVPDSTIGAAFGREMARSTDG